MENFCRVRAETIEPLAIFRPVTLKFCRQNGPRFGVQKRTPKWRPLIQSQFDLLVSGRLGPRFGVQKTDPKTGAVCRQNFCRRAKIVQVSIVSAGARQKFCIPLGHWVPMVLQRREQLFSTPCERLCPHLFLNFKNMCGHKCSPGVENKCLRRCKTMEKQRHGKLLSRTCRNNRTSCYFSPGDLKILPTKRPPFWGPKTDPKMEATHSVSI